MQKNIFDVLTGEFFSGGNLNVRNLIDSDINLNEFVTY